VLTAGTFIIASAKSYALKNSRTEDWRSIIYPKAYYNRKNDSISLMSIRETIISLIRAVAQEQDKQLGPLIDDLALVESGLDSLDFAIIVARLEDSMGVDPFSDAIQVNIPVTLAEFIGYYENAAK
jgi:acyl carrier protein